MLIGAWRLKRLILLQIQQGAGRASFGVKGCEVDPASFLGYLVNWFVNSTLDPYGCIGATKQHPKLREAQDKLWKLASNPFTVLGEVRITGNGMPFPALGIFSERRNWDWRPELPKTIEAPWP